MATAGVVALGVLIVQSQPLFAENIAIEACNYFMSEANIPFDRVIGQFDLHEGETEHTILDRYQTITWTDALAPLYKLEYLLTNPDPIDDQVGTLSAQIECLVDVVDRRVIRLTGTPGISADTPIKMRNGVVAKARATPNFVLEVGSEGHQGKF